MEYKTELQYQFCSRLDDMKFCAYDHEVFEQKTSPILHQTSRFLFVKKGKGKIKINEVEYEIKENSLVSILPFDCTEITHVDQTLQTMKVVYNFVVINDVIKSVFNVDNQQNSIIERMQDYPVIQITGESLDLLLDLFRRIRKEIGLESALEDGEKGHLSSVYVVNMLIEIMVLAQRQMDENHQEGRRVKGVPQEKTAIFRYIYTHLSEKLTLNRVAKHFFMSESSISKYILETTGLTFNNLVNEIKVAKTLNYLMYTDYTLEELASILGYVDAAHISKVFETRIGTKISEYRKTYNSVLQACNVEERRMGYRLVTYIVENHTEEITAATVAKEFDITMQELNKILLLMVEMNFLEFLHSLRINSACTLLVETDMAITDIAIEVGFNTVKTFTRNFVHQKHVTPSNYRLTIKGEKEDEDS